MIDYFCNFEFVSWAFCCLELVMLVTFCWLFLNGAGGWISPWKLDSVRCSAITPGRAKQLCCSSDPPVRSLSFYYKKKTDIFQPSSMVLVVGIEPTRPFELRILRQKQKSIYILYCLGSSNFWHQNLTPKILLFFNLIWHQIIVML